MFGWLGDFLIFFVIVAIILACLYIVGLMRSPYVPPSTLLWKDIKPHVETGDIMLFKTDSVVGKVAQCFDASPYFHIAMVCIGPDGRIFLVEHDNSKTIKRDGTFFVDFETKMQLYPNSNLAILKYNRPAETRLQYENVIEIFKKYLTKFSFQKNPLGWLRMIIHHPLYYKMIGENNKLLCIEQVSLMLRDLGVFKPETNIHDLSPSKYFNMELPFSKGYKGLGLVPFQYQKK